VKKATIGERFRDWLLTTVLAATLGGCILFAYWLFWPYEIIRLGKFCVDTFQVEQGREICFVFEGEKLIDLPGEVLLELVNGHVETIKSYKVQNRPGEKLKKRCISIPYQAKPEKDYHLRWTVTYHPNPIRSVSYMRESPHFEVLVNPRLKDLR
jgi:hypothetical protein